MTKERALAFSDGVIAILITILVLELKIPHGSDLAALAPILPVFLVYVLSFVGLGIYWNNHHHMFHVVHRINGQILWANLHLLFWLSLFPFITGWMGENLFSTVPTLLYGVVLLMAGIAYYVLQRVIIASQGSNSLLARAIGNDVKGKLSPILYATAILVSLFESWIAHVIYVCVALIWLVPDRRIERTLATGSTERSAQT